MFPAQEHNMAPPKLWMTRLTVQQKRYVRRLFRALRVEKVRNHSLKKRVKKMRKALTKLTASGNDALLVDLGDRNQGNQDEEAAAEVSGSESE